MISLSIYIIAFMIIMAIVGSITVFFSNQTKDINMNSGASAEYSKFNLYMLEFTKGGYEILKCSEDINAEEQFVTFSKNGKSDTFLKVKEGDILYFNQIKLCENVDEFKLEKTVADNGKEVLKTYLKIDGTVYTTDYVVE